MFERHGQSNLRNSQRIKIRVRLPANFAAPDMRKARAMVITTEHGCGVGMGAEEGRV